MSWITDYPQRWFTCVCGCHAVGLYRGEWKGEKDDDISISWWETPTGWCWWGRISAAWKLLWYGRTQHSEAILPLEKAVEMAQALLEMTKEENNG